MDFFRRVFKSDSKTELRTSPSGSDSDGGLFGGLDVNETEPSLDETPDTSPSTPPQASNPTASSSFTSEFSFINNTPTQPPARETSDHEAQPTLPSTATSTSTPPSPSSSVEKPLKKSSGVTKPKKKGDGTAKATDSSSPGKPKKIVKKRTLENRPGYGVEEVQAPVAPTTSTPSTPDKKSSPTQVIAPATPPAATLADSSSSIGEKSLGASSEGLDNEEGAKQKPGEAILRPESQESHLSALQLEYDALVDDFRSRLSSLANDIGIEYQRTAEKLLELGEMEKKLAQLRLDLKAASDDEKYERAAELNLVIDANLEKADLVRKELEESQEATRKFEAAKTSLLKEFVNTQSALLFRISELKTAQTKTVSHIQDHLSSLESETTTVYASKIELLEERLSDVQSELERIVDREQKLESKILLGAQGLADSVKEDSTLVISLEDEIEKLREKLAAKEALLSTVQTRLKSNQAKVDALRKEHSSYLDDIQADKSKKMETLVSLKLEKSQLDTQLLRQHERIEKEKNLLDREKKVIANVDQEAHTVEERISSATQAVDLFSTPVSEMVRQVMEADLKEDGIAGIAHAGTGAEQSSASATGSLSHIKQKVQEQKTLIASTELQIAEHKQQLKQWKTEQEEARKSVPLLEQSKQVAVSAKDYKEAARLKAEIASVQALIEQQTTDMDHKSEQLTSNQQDLLAQQATLAELLAQLDVAEAGQATERLQELAKLVLAARCEARRLSLSSTSSASSATTSPLNEGVLQLSLSQLTGFVEVARGESAYLAMKYGLEIPAEIPLPEIAISPADVPPSDAEAITADQPIDADPISGEVVESEQEGRLEEREESEPVIEDEGLFDGLDEADAEQGEYATQEPNATDAADTTTKNENPPSSSNPEAVSTEAQEIEILTGKIQAAKSELAEAEAAEDYEKAEETHQLILSLQEALTRLEGS